MCTGEAILARRVSHTCKWEQNELRRDLEFHLQKPYHDLSFLAYMEPKAAIPGLAFPDPSTRRLSAQLDPRPAFPIQAGSQ